MIHVLKRSIRTRLWSLAASPKVLPLTLLVGLLLRVVSISIIRSYSHPVTWEFGMIAQEIFHGHGYTELWFDGARVPSAFMPPLYSYFLSSCWTLMGQSASCYLAIEIIQAFLGVWLILIVYRTTRILMGDRVANVAALMISIWPTFVYVCNEFHSINFYIAFGSLAVYHLVRYCEVSHALRDMIWFGVWMGLLTLCRAEAVALIVVYAAILVWLCGRTSVGATLAACLISLAILAPWSIRNSLAFGHFIAVTDTAGFNLWIGHNPQAQGDATWDESYLTTAQRIKLSSVQGSRDSEFLRDKHYKAFAIEFARTHLRTEISLAIRKIGYFIFFDPHHKKSRRPAYWVPSLLLTFLGGVGAWVRRRHLLREDLFLVSSVLFAAVVSMVVFALPRYRIMIDPFVAMYAAVAIVWMLDSDRYLPKKQQ